MPYALFSFYSYHRICPDGATYFQEESYYLGEKQGEDLPDDSLINSHGTCSLDSGGVVDCYALSHGKDWWTQHLHYLAIYPALQAAHWDVGFLKQYTLRQIPNFLLATPILVIAVRAISKGFSSVINITPPRRVQDVALSLLLPHICHLAFLFLICVSSAHIQVSTRVLLSSCPVLYIAMNDIVNSKDGSRIEVKLLVGYLICYNVVGVVAHTNFYPWT
jgi:Gpi18-like mannosyltransferase